MTEEIYRLGQVFFSVDGGATETKLLLDKLNMRTAGDGSRREFVRLSGQLLFKELINEVFKLHSHCIWLDAACVVSPNGKKVLIIGKSYAGKSTLSLLFGIGFGWTVLSEDIVLIDTCTNEIVDFNSPFSVRDGTLERVTSISGKTPITIGEWIPRISPHHKIYAPFDLVLVLELNRPPGAMSAVEIRPELIQSMILRNSNLLRRQGWSDLFFTYLLDAAAFKVIDGTLAERAEFIQALVGEKVGEVS